MSEGQKIEVPSFLYSDSDKFNTKDQKFSVSYLLTPNDYKYSNQSLTNHIIHSGEDFNKFEITKNEILKFGDLSYNWDGYDAIPPSEQLIETTIKVIASLGGNIIEKIDEIFPTPNGTITIQWKNELKELLSLEIGNNSYSYFIKYNNQNPKFVDGESLFLAIKSISTDLSGLFA